MRNSRNIELQVTITTLHCVYSWLHRNVSMYLTVWTQTLFVLISGHGGDTERDLYVLLMCENDELGVNISSDASPFLLFLYTICILMYSVSCACICNQQKLEPKQDELFCPEEGTNYQEMLLEMTGQKTVPNVFINKTHLGGCDNTLKVRNKCVSIIDCLVGS